MENKSNIPLNPGIQKYFYNFPVFKWFLKVYIVYLPTYLLMLLHCEYCHYEWEYKGTSILYVTCPYCHYKLKLSNYQDYTGKRKDTRNWYNYFRNMIKLNYIPCRSCLDLKAVEVHHKDKNKNNNSYWNFDLLCSSCHSNIHHPDVPAPIISSTAIIAVLV